MSTNRYSKEAGFVDPRKLPKGPSGRALCRRCQREVGKGRRTFCSDDCVHEWKIRTSPSYMRECVFRRDQGICAICRINTGIIYRLFSNLLIKANLNHLYWRWAEMCDKDPERYQSLVRFRCRFPWFRADISPWAADHIIPVVEGGGECGLENIRTLCLGCHDEETGKLRERLKLKRRERSLTLFARETKADA